MPSGKGRKACTLVETNPTSIKNMLLGLEMADRVAREQDCGQGG